VHFPFQDADWSTTINNCFNAHFPVKPELTGSPQLSSLTLWHRISYGPDALPFTQPTVSKHWRKHKALNPARHRASTSTRWHFAFGLCCHSNETRAPIANQHKSAQPEGTPTIPPGYIWVNAVVWACGRRQRQKHRQTRVTNIHFALSTTHMKCNYSPGLILCSVTRILREGALLPLCQLNNINSMDFSASSGEILVVIPYSPPTTHPRLGEESKTSRWSPCMSPQPWICGNYRNAASKRTCTLQTTSYSVLKKFH